MAVIHFEILRRIAETASGMRYQNLWFEVTDTDVIVHEGDPPDPAPQNTFVIPCTGWAKPDIPPVTHACIASDTNVVDLLKVEVPAQELQGWNSTTMAADAVFWSASAVEKFLMPYYASTYGSMAPKAVAQLLNVFVPPESPELLGNGMIGFANQAQVTGTAMLGTPEITVTNPPDYDQPFAVVHLPSSEYTAGAPAGGGDPLPRLFTLHKSGAVKKLRVMEPEPA